MQYLTDNLRQGWIWQDYLPHPPWYSFPAPGSASGPSIYRYFDSCVICVYFIICVMLVNDFLSDTIFQVMKIHQVKHSTNVFY